MAATSTAICNLSLTRMGEDLVDDITDANGTVLEQKCNLLYTQALEETTSAGPELGWKFAKRRKRLDRESMTITAFALLTSTTVTVTATHTLLAGDLVDIEGTTSYDGQYEVLTITSTTSFSITATFVADDATGTAKWTSEDKAYRFAIPSDSLRVTSVKVGGIEITDWLEEGVFILTNQTDTDTDIHYVRSVTTTTLFPPHFTRVLVLTLAIELSYNLTQDLNMVKILEQELEFKAMPKAIAIDERGKHVQESSTSWVDAGNFRDNLE